jgi:hypothetical protein
VAVLVFIYLQILSIILSYRVYQEAKRRSQLIT